MDIYKILESLQQLEDKHNLTEDAEHKYLVTYSNVNSGNTYTALVPADDEYEARDRINNAAGFGTRVQSVKPARGNEQTDQEWKVFKDPRRNGAGQAMLVDRGQGSASNLNEDLQADDGEYYDNSDDFFSQFEADQFDDEKVSPDGMEVRGYIDGVNVMAWRYESSEQIGGWGVYDDSYLGQGMAEDYNPVESDYEQWEYILVKDGGAGGRGNASGAYALELVVGHQGSDSDWISAIRNILTYVKQNRAVLGKEVSDETGKTVKDAIIDIKREYPQLYQAAQQPTGMAEGPMGSAEKNSRGPKFTGYWKGTDKRTPGKHMVGAAESVQREISEGWNNYLAEFGADNAGGTAGLGQTVADKQKAAKEISNVTGAINKAKSTGVLPQGLGTTQAAQAIMQDPEDVNSATTSQKKELGAAGDSFNDFIKAASTTPGGQSALNTVLSAMKKIKSTPGA